MPGAVILSALRTPVGTAYKGTLRDTTAFDLADHVVRATADGLDPERVDDVILAEAWPAAASSPGTPPSRPASRTFPAWLSTGTARRACRRSRPRPARFGPAWTS
jgi:acetyl-CoA acetyltransferase